MSAKKSPGAVSAAARAGLGSAEEHDRGQLKLPFRFKQRLSHKTGTGRHPLADRGDDLYSTPPEAVTALLEAVCLPKRLWDPCSGRQNIVARLRAAGHTVIASDINNYDLPLDFQRDFLAVKKAPAGVLGIVCNPPYKNAAEFAEHALELVPFAAMLLKLTFLELERRTALLESGRLAHVLPFRNRLPMMHRDGWNGPRASSAMAFAWFVWSRDHQGRAEIQRISWKEL